jgi:hypothetical protein
MTIRQQGGVFGRNPTFNDVTIDGSANLGSNVDINGGTIDGTSIGATIVSTGAFSSLNCSDLLSTTPLSVNLSGNGQQVLTTKSFILLSGNGAARSNCFLQNGTISGQVLRIRAATWAVTIINNPSGTQNAIFNNNAASVSFGNGSGQIAAMDLIFDTTYGVGGTWFELGRSTFP